LLRRAATAGGLTQGDDGNVVGIDWRTVLDPVLRDNGGPTWTHALLAGSAAVDTGSDADAVDPRGQPLATDQRGPGFPRILRGHVDIGAFELTNSGPTATNDFLRVREDLAAEGNLLPNDSDPDSDELTVVAVNGVAMAVGFAVALPSGAIVTVNSDGSFVYNPNDAFEGLVPGETAVDFFTYSISDSQGGIATAKMRIVVFGAGTADLVGYFDGQWYVGVSDATSFDSSTWADWPAIAPSAVRQGDFNGDGGVDVLGFVNGAWWVGVSHGSSFVTKQWGAWTNLAWQDVTVGDLDSDGKDDILARYHGSWWLALSNGTGFDTPERWTMWSDKPWQHVSLVDLDADGDADLLANLNGAWWASLSTGSGFETAHRWGRWGHLASSAVGTFDANGDGRTDVYAFSRGTWDRCAECVERRCLGERGRRRFQRRWIRRRRCSLYHRVVGESLDTDGRSRTRHPLGLLEERRLAERHCRGFRRRRPRRSRWSLQIRLVGRSLEWDRIQDQPVGLMAERRLDRRRRGGDISTARLKSNDLDVSASRERT
jgi:hypothetical protein